MRSARAVSTKLLRAWSPLSTQIYGTPIDCLVITSANLAICRLGVLRRRRDQPARRALLAGDNHPGDAGDLVCQGHDDLVGVHARLELIEPGTESVPGSVEVHHA